MSTPDAADDASPSPEYSGDQDDDALMAEQKDSNANEADASPTRQQTGIGAKSNAKDPQRPRRKKARRACMACQRAHLTCGDERPCQRCIKRGLQDACHDGIRKKAKYLHDAPPEALMPGMAGHYPHVNGLPAPLSQSPSMPVTAVSLAQSAAYYPSHAQQGHYDPYGQNQAHMPPPPPTNASFGSQPSPLSPPFNPLGSQQSPQIQQMPQSSSQPQLNQYGVPIFDPSDPALFNFDITNLNFTNNYGALEFGMLSHMSSGAGDQPGGDNSYNLQGSMVTPNYVDVQPILFPQDALMNADWQNHHPRQDSTTQLLLTPHNTPITSTIDALRHEGNGHSHAYAIGAGPSSLASASPSSTGPDMIPPGYDNGPLSPAVFGSSNQLPTSQPPQTSYTRQHPHSHQQPHSQTTSRMLSKGPNINASSLHPQTHGAFTRKRRKPNPDIYASIKEPYEYTARFHALFSLLRRSMSSEKVSRIAKLMASVRPSLISLMMNLSEQDLVHNEQSLVRQLIEYEDFIAATGTPTILIRRTGEVVLCNKEFSILTGWHRDVLLGKEANLNTNAYRSGNATGASTLSSNKAGTTTPRIPAAELEGQAEQQGGGATGATAPKPQAIFLPELLDDDSVVQFYEDYAKLAWGDSRGKVHRPVRLIKYRGPSKDELDDDSEANHAEYDQRGRNDQARGKQLGGPVALPTGKALGLGRQQQQQPVPKLENGIYPEQGIYELGETEGMVSCMCCWSVKRDMFELPMLIVMSFLPIM